MPLAPLMTGIAPQDRFSVRSGDKGNPIRLFSRFLDSREKSLEKTFEKTLEKTLEKKSPENAPIFSDRKPLRYPLVIDRSDISPPQAKKLVCFQDCLIHFLGSVSIWRVYWLMVCDTDRSEQSASRLKRV
mgnify:CR=1 FL=1